MSAEVRSSTEVRSSAEPDSPADSGRPAKHRVRMPGFTAAAEVGLGDAIKRATSTAGIRPCGPCQQRAARLNRWMSFHG